MLATDIVRGTAIVVLGMLQATLAGCGECQAGCFSGVSIQLTTPLDQPGPYSIRLADDETGESVECLVGLNQDSAESIECAPSSTQLILDLKRSAGGATEIHGFLWPDRAPRSASIRIEHSDSILVQTTVEPNYNEDATCGELCLHGLAVLQQQMP